jgi:predicted dehydrogenase
MHRLGIIGLDTTHGFIYPALLNGYDPAALARHSPPIVSGIFGDDGLPAVAGARVVACYDDDPARARAVADACLIERVCRTPAEALADVDGALVCGGDAARHRELATPALEAGLPTFVDKPFTEAVADSLALLALADRRGAPLFCASALRYADGVLALRERLPALVGEPLAAHSIGTGDFDAYAVHSLEMLYGLWGGGVTAVQSLGGPGHDVVRLVYGDGRQALWQVCRRAGWYFHLGVFGAERAEQVVVTQPDRYRLFRAVAERIAAFLRTGRSPVPPSETLEIVRVLAAARRQRGDPALMPLLA